MISSMPEHTLLTRQDHSQGGNWPQDIQYMSETSFRIQEESIVVRTLDELSLSIQHPSPPPSYSQCTGLIKATNVYLAKKQETAAAVANGTTCGLLPAGPQPLLLRKAAAYVTRILSVFGIIQV